MEEEFYIPSVILNLEELFQENEKKKVPLEYNKDNEFYSTFT